MTAYPHLIVYADGGSRGNPGPAAIGVVISTPEGKVLYERGERIGIATNNKAEYQGLIHALEQLRQFNPAAVEVRMDSQLVVEQLSGRYRVKNAGLKPLYARALAALAALGATVSFEHVLRHHNAQADKLLNKALDAR